MQKVPGAIAIVGGVFSVFALGVTIWLLFFATENSSLVDQTVYWFLIALVAAVIPHVKQLKWNDLEVHLQDIKATVDELANRRYANLIYLIDNRGNLALIQHQKYKVWIPCGTRLNPYEQPHEAVHRAISEELGLTQESYEFWPKREYPDYGTVKIVPAPFQVQEEYRTHRSGLPEHYDFVFVCRTLTERPTLSGKRGQAARWVSFEEFSREVESGEIETVTFADVLPTYKEILAKTELASRSSHSEGSLQ